MIEINNLTKRYGALLAVDNISFSVGPGEVLGFLGPNGSVRLSRNTILWPGSRGPLPAIIAGAPSTLGISTRLE